MYIAFARLTGISRITGIHWIGPRITGIGPENELFNFLVYSQLMALKHMLKKKTTTFAHL